MSDDAEGQGAHRAPQQEVAAAELQTEGENQTVTLREVFTYKPGANGGTTSQVATYTVTAGDSTTTYAYDYDQKGNITRITTGSTAVDYTYDAANQLIREDNPYNNTTYSWTYDNAGNILSCYEYAYTTGSLSNASVLTPRQYTYDSQWRDLLTCYDVMSYTTDAIGNLLYDGTWDYEWEHGRQLKAMTQKGAEWYFTYNADGLRTQRKLYADEEITYNYIYNGSQLTHMTVGEDELHFSYDASGVPMTLTYNGETYYYTVNLQGDITGIYTAAGTQVVAYTYDAWGNILDISGYYVTTLGILNPLRYRGYVYDQETGLYYLQSRYYNPKVGRFINADAFTSTGQGFEGNNMFCYCLNNPVNSLDPTGNMCFLAIGHLIAGPIVDMSLPDCKEETYGAAPDYIEIAAAKCTTSDSQFRQEHPNCYSYAICEYQRSYDPGDFSGTTFGTSVGSVALCVVFDTIARGESIRIITGPEAKIRNDEYRVALRVSDYNPYRSISWDYHFMVQTSNGCWAEKHGPGGATVLHASGNPNTITWDCGPYKGFYNSEIIYFAISIPQNT